MEKTDVPIVELKKQFHPLNEEEQFLMYMRIRDLESFYGDKLSKATKKTDKEKYQHIFTLMQMITSFMTGGNEFADATREWSLNYARTDYKERTIYKLVPKGE